MTTPHHNPKRIRKRLVRSIIHIEHAVPHSRPEVIRSQSQEELKDSWVVVVVEARSPLARLVVLAADCQFYS